MNKILFSLLSFIASFYNSQGQNCWPTCNITFEQIFKERCPTENDIVGINPDWIYVQSANYNTRQFKLNDEQHCGVEVLQLLKNYRQDDLNNWPYLRNMACSYLSGWYERVEGVCQKGGPPPCCPVDHWIKDVETAKLKYKSVQKAVYDKRMAKIKTLIDKCVLDVRQGAENNFNHLHSRGLELISKIENSDRELFKTYIAELQIIEQKFNSEIKKKKPDPNIINGFLKQIDDKVKLIEKIVQNADQTIKRKEQPSQRTDNVNTYSQYESNNEQNVRQSQAKVHDDSKYVESMNRYEEKQENIRKTAEIAQDVISNLTNTLTENMNNRAEERRAQRLEQMQEEAARRELERLEEKQKMMEKQEEQMKKQQIEDERVRQYNFDKRIIKEHLYEKKIDDIPEGISQVYYLTYERYINGKQIFLTKYAIYSYSDGTWMPHGLFKEKCKIREKFDKYGSATLIGYFTTIDSMTNVIYDLSESAENAGYELLVLKEIKSVNNPAINERKSEGDFWDK